MGREFNKTSKIVEEKTENFINPFKLEVRIGVYDRRSFVIKETVPIQFIIKNVSNKSLKIIDIDNALPYGFRFLELGGNNKNVIFVGNCLRINRTLFPGEIFQIFLKAEVAHPVYKFKYIIKISWQEPTSNYIKKSSVGIFDYSIFKVLSMVSARELRESTNESLFYWENKEIALKYIRELGIKEISIKSFLENTLPFYFSFITYDLRKHKDHVLADKNVLREITEYIRRKELPNITFIIGSSFIGKTTFAANLLYYGLKANNKKIFVISLKGKKQGILDLIDSKIKKETMFASAGELISYSMDSNNEIEIWLDVDHYMNKNANHEITSFLNRDIIKHAIKEKILRIFIIMNEKRFYDIASSIDIPYNLITLHIYTNEAMMNIVNTFGEKDSSKIKLLKSILDHDKQNIFFKPSFLSYLLKAINAFISGRLVISSESFIAERLIITAIDLFRKDNLDNMHLPKANWISELSDELYIEESKSKNPEFLREIKITAIDLETNYVLSREIDDIARAKLNLNSTKILFIGGESGTGKTVLALKLGYELWKQGMYVFFVDIGEIEESELLPTLEILESICYSFVIIIDNAHLDTERDILMRFYKINPYKIIVTERTPKDETIVGEMIDYYLREKKVLGISKKPKLKLGELAFEGLVDEVIFRTRDFKKFVESAIQFAIKNNLIVISPATNIEHLINEMVKKTRETIILVRFILRYYIEHKSDIALSTQSLSKISLREVIEYYISVLVNDIREELKTESKPSRYAYLIEPILVYLSIFSKYEIFTPGTFIKKRLEDILNISDGIEVILDKLAKRREITQRSINKQAIELYIDNFYIIPHASLAFNFWEHLSYKYNFDQENEFAYLLFEKSVDIGNVLVKIYKYSEKDEFCARVVTKLADLLKNRAFEYQFIEKLEKYTTLHSVFQLLWGLERINRELFIKIINNAIYFEKLFSQRKMVKESLKDALLILYLFQETPQLDRMLYLKYVKIVKKVIEKCDISKLDIYEILLAVNSDILDENELNRLLSAFFNNALMNEDSLLEIQKSLLDMPLSQLRKTLESLYLASKEFPALLSIYHPFINKLLSNNERLIEKLSKESTRKKIDFIFFLKNKLKMMDFSKKILLELSERKNINLKDLEFNVLGELLGKIFSIDNDLGLLYFETEADNILKKITTLKRLIEFLDRIYRYNKTFGNKISENKLILQHALTLFTSVTFGELQSIIDDPSLDLNTKKFLFNLLTTKKDFTISLLEAQKLDDVIFLLEIFTMMKEQWITDDIYREQVKKILYVLVDIIFSRLNEGDKIKSATSYIILLRVLKIYGKDLNFKELIELCRQYNATKLLSKSYSSLRNEKRVKDSIERKFFLLMNTLFEK